MSSSNRIALTFASVLFLGFFSCTSSEGQQKKSTTASKKKTTTADGCGETTTTSKKTSSSKKSSDDADLRLTAELVTYESDIKQLLDDHCVSCHGKGAQDPDLTSYDALISEKSEIISTIQDESMPPDTPFNTTKKETFNLWKQNDFAEGEASSSDEDKTKEEDAEEDDEASASEDDEDDEEESSTSSSKCGSSTSSKTTSGTSSKKTSSSKDTVDEDN